MNKLMKDFFFINKECGFADAVFYFFYKINLRFRLLPSIAKRNARRLVRVEKIYAALSLLKYPSSVADGKKFIHKKISGTTGKMVMLRCYSSDTKVFNQVIENEEYKSVMQMYRQLFSETPRHIFDCGANIGLASIYFHQHYPEAYFTVIEPFPENVSIIKSNFESCAIKNFLLLEGGVWNSNARLSINREFRDGKEWSVSLSAAENGGGDIKGYSLADLVEQSANPVDILKVDIEGAEKLLFEEPVYAKRFLSNVKCIAIEIHDEFNIRDSIYKVLGENNFFYYDTGELTIGINRKYASL